MLKNQRGFALTPLLAGLVILAVIALLAYVYVGQNSAATPGNMKNLAIAKIHDDFEQIDTALKRYAEKHGSYPATPDLNSLVADGMLASLPQMDPAANAPGCWQPYCRYQLFYSMDIGGTAAKDVVLYGAQINDDYCRAFNAKYTTWGDSIPTWDAAHAAKTPLACLDASPGNPDVNEVLRVVEFR